MTIMVAFSSLAALTIASPGLIPPSVRIVPEIWNTAMIRVGSLNDKEYNTSTNFMVYGNALELNYQAQ